MSDKIWKEETGSENRRNMSNEDEELVWEISEDDFEETRDLMEAAARIAEMERQNEQESRREQPGEGQMRKHPESGGSGERPADVMLYEREEQAEPERRSGGRESVSRQERFQDREEYARDHEEERRRYKERDREESRRPAGEADSGRPSRSRDDDVRRSRRREEAQEREDRRAGEDRRNDRERQTGEDRRNKASRQRREEDTIREDRHTRDREDRRAGDNRRKAEDRRDREKRQEREGHQEREDRQERESRQTGMSSRSRENGGRTAENRQKKESRRYEEDRRSRESIQEDRRQEEKVRRRRPVREWEEEDEEWEPVPSGRRSSRRRRKNPIVEFWCGLQPMDKVVGITGIAVCFFAVLTFSMVAGARGMDRQVEAFAQVGENMAQISVAGEGTFLAVADAHMARQQAAEAVEEEESQEEYEEREEPSDVQVGLNMTSVEKDLKIKFVNRKTGKLIPQVNFQVEIKGPDKTYQETDGDKDGIIYLTGLTGGNYTVRITGPGDLAGYIIPTDAQSVTVKGQIEFKKIDVADEIKSESEVNAAKEDTQVKIPVESTIQDTVEWVESTKIPVGGDSNAYSEVKKEDIPDPAATASLEYALFAGMKSQGNVWSGPGRSSDRDGGDLRSRERGSQENRTSSLTGVREDTWEILRLSDTVQTEQPSSSEEPSSTPEPSSQEPSSSEEPSSSQEPSSSEPTDTPPSSSESPAPSKKVTGVSVSAASTSLTVGDTAQLSVKITPEDAENKTVSWKSGSESIATVSSSGLVTAKSPGSVTIMATSADGPRGEITLTVAAKTVPVQSVTLSGSNQVEVGATTRLTASVTPSDATTTGLTWSSSDSTVATVDGSGNVKGIKAGNVTITVTVGGKTGSMAVAVKAKVSNSLTVSDMTLIAGETKKANYTATGNIASTTFSIENTKFATVDTNGNVKAIRAGETTYTVTVKFSDGTTSTDKKKLVVKAASVSGITLDRTSVTLKVGESLKLNPKIETPGYTGCLWYSTDKTIVTVEEHGGGIIKALKPGKVTITACSSEDTSKKATCEVTVVSDKDPRADTTTPLKDKNGNRLYYRDSNGKYIEAVVADYYKYSTFYRLNDNVEYKYTGWQTIDGKRYYFDKNGNKITGEQVIQGVKYTFGGDGALSAGSGVLGIDVSRHNGNINWDEVRNSGVSFVIIRCGYRGSATGAMIEDQKFRSNIQGAAAAGLKVGIYFFSQAVNRVEAVEEASMTIDLIKSYKISYPVFLDVEAAGGRADGIDAGTRTEIINAYCQTLKNSGYTAGVYANKTWLGSKINVGSLGGSRIWLAQYAAAPTYGGRYDMWQYSSKGRIGGISGDVDLNISYLGY